MANLVYSIQMKDADGNTTAVTVYAKHASATLAQLQSWGTALGDVVDTAIDGKVTKVSLIVDVPIGSPKANPVAGSNIQETALLTFDATGSPYNFSLDIPSWLEAGFSGKSVDETNAAFQALRDYLLGTVNTIQASDRYGNAFAGFLKGRKTFRKFRKQASKA